MAFRFRAGDRVCVSLPKRPGDAWHRYNGMTYEHECWPGLTGTIQVLRERDGKEEGYARVAWDDIPPPSGYGEAADSSRIDLSCLEPIEDEAEIQKAIRSILGNAPDTPHCGTCTCFAKE